MARPDPEPGTGAARRAAAGLEPSRRGRREQIALPVEWPGEVTREWAWGDSTGKGVRVCILDSGVERGASARRRRPAVGGRLARRGRRSRASPTTRRATSAGTGRPARGSSARSRPDCELDERPRPRRRLHRERRRPARRPALGGRAGLRRRQHEPLDDEAPVRRDPPRAHRHAPTSAARCSSRRRTTCRSRATRGASPR